MWPTNPTPLPVQHPTGPRLLKQPIETQYSTPMQKSHIVDLNRAHVTIPTFSSTVQTQKINTLNPKPHKFKAKNNNSKPATSNHNKPYNPRDPSTVTTPSFFLHNPLSLLSWKTNLVKGNSNEKDVENKLQTTELHL